MNFIRVNAWLWHSLSIPYNNGQTVRRRVCFFMSHICLQKMRKRVRERKRERWTLVNTTYFGTSCLLGVELYPSVYLSTFRRILVRHFQGQTHCWSMNVKTLPKLGNYTPKDAAEFPLRLNLQQHCYESFESPVAYVFSFIKVLESVYEHSR
jgi:hypothetical protein